MLQTCEISIFWGFHVPKLSSTESKQLQSSSFAKTGSFTAVKFPVIPVEAGSGGLCRADGRGVALITGGRLR